VRWPLFRKTCWAPGDNMLNLYENSADPSTSRESMLLASTEITWLLRYDVDPLWMMSLHEAESRSFDRL
jgi:hypothetical protein